MAIIVANDPVLKITNLSKSFDGIRAIDGLSLEFKSGELTAIIGPNGSGKTTLFNLITGFWKPDSGQIHFGNHNITGQVPHVRATLGISRTFQNIRLLPQMTVLDNVLIALKHPFSDHLWGALHKSQASREQDKANIARAIELLSMVGIEEKQHSLGRELSHGQRRLLEFARAMALEPKVVLLDEPLAGLFPSMVTTVKQLMRAWKAEGRTVLFIEHDVNAVMDISNRVIVLHQGQLIADGTPYQIQQIPAVVEVYLGRRHRKNEYK